MFKTILTVIIAVTIVAAVSYGFYAYTRPVVAPTVENTKLTNTANTNSTTKIYLVALEDGGKSGEKIGCGDSLVAVDVPISTNAVDASGLTPLLNIQDKTYGQSGLYNALYQSDLKVDNITYENDGTKIIVALLGKVVSGGACDDSRIQQQLIETIKVQDPVINTVRITVNDKSIDQVLSGSGQ